ncbi:MAG: isoprenylcysteine carboxylmethyltransferase family protein [Candidatus Eremiobacteraeota bacterium]|nr:isoprenylcysteine carboxylmethyltransferase family protein [Candidatus Eremiobacteraeota bacterium]
MPVHAAMLVVFALGTAAICYYSWWLSLRARRYHGIPRFVAFESLLLMVLLNAGSWFKDPFCLRQIVSWIVLFASLYPSMAGYLLLRGAGRAEGTFENTSVLVKSGVYKYIRHPLYTSLLLLGVGVFLKDVTILTTILMLVSTAALFATALMEEREMVRKFGGEYEAYMKETKRFIPFLY